MQLIFHRTRTGVTLFLCIIIMETSVCTYVTICHLFTYVSKIQLVWLYCLNCLTSIHYAYIIYYAQRQSDHSLIVLGPLLPRMNEGIEQMQVELLRSQLLTGGRQVVIVRGYLSTDDGMGINQTCTTAHQHCFLKTQL